MFIVDGDVFADVIDLKAPQVVSEDAHILSKLFFAKKAAIGKRLQRSDSVKHRTNASQNDAAQRRPGGKKNEYHVVIISYFI